MIPFPKNIWNFKLYHYKISNIFAIFLLASKEPLTAMKLLGKPKLNHTPSWITAPIHSTYMELWMPKIEEKLPMYFPLLPLKDQDKELNLDDL